ncbi:hypothetical protein ABZ192_41525 [Streptomyces sp. NPDC006235]|uniref:hypothetical protein n=1 Tax=Streptomyces sp. NPDC006235 TaxID=3156736 RepID=UPI00339DBD6F
MLVVVDGEEEVALGLYRCTDQDAAVRVGVEDLASFAQLLPAIPEGCLADIAAFRLDEPIRVLRLV